MKLALLGDPVDHSLSPSIFHTALSHFELSGSYETITCQPSSLQKVLKCLYESEFDGANVTTPCKVAICNHLTELTSETARIGAVNTIWRNKRGWSGGNTDIAGFRATLARMSFVANNHKALVLGAGGAARAVAVVLCDDGWEVFIAARRTEQTIRLTADFGYPRTLHVADWNASSRTVRECSLLVNTIPSNAITVSEFDNMLSGVPDRITAFDLNYHPRETPLLATLRGIGVRNLMNGIPMLIEQAAESFRIWTGCTLPMEWRMRMEQTL